MPGGLIQLIQGLTNAADALFFGNPQMSFFRIVYKRHTNFAVENIEAVLEKNYIQQDEETIIEYKIPRYADLLSNIYFRFNLPDVYSGFGKNAGAVEASKFKWSKNIGCNIIEKAELLIDNTVVETITGEWLRIWADLHLSGEEKESFDEMTGNIDEIHTPELREWYVNHPGSFDNVNVGTGSTVTQNSGVYPISVTGNQYNKWNAVTNTGIIAQDPVNAAIKMNESLTALNANISNNDDFIPSIKGRIVRVPLKFFFTKNPGLALPLIALQYSEVKVRITLRKYLDLYTIIETNNAAGNRNRIKPTTGQLHHNLDCYIRSENMLTSKQLKINCRLDIEYVYMDDKERIRFAQNSLEYLVEKIKLPIIVNNNVSEKNPVFEMNSIRPVKYFVLAMQRSDAAFRNDWNNYTNWIFEDVAPDSYAYTKLGNEIFNDSSSATQVVTQNKFFYTYDIDGNNDDYEFLLSGISQTTRFSQQYLKKNIVEKIQLKMNGHDRFKETDFRYFETSQKYTYFKNSTRSGIYCYSFALNPSEFQPSGMCDFSKIDKVQLSVEINQPPYVNNALQQPYHFIAKLFIVEYNILRITSGMGALAFAE